MKRSYFLCLSFFSLIFLQAEDTPTYTLIESSEEYPILTPTLQKRKTVKIELTNGVKAYLISDPEVDQSAASVSVQVGSWQDPEEYPGMAHFLEHMLFMGNKAYPDESEYSQYIQDNGGILNAFTMPDRTVYMFCINNPAFEGAIDRFSHFFIDPLFKVSCINRELLAVDQENSKNIENDAWREYMVLKETSNPKHPNQKFSTGNAKTLGGIPREALQNWYETYYSANRMHLILLSNQSIDEMIALANKYFSQIPIRDTLPELSYSEPMLSSEQKGHFIHIKPVKDLRNLSLVWELPKQFASIDEKWTAELISYALEQASDSSLIQQLKKEGLAESINAGLDRFGQDTALYNLVVQLTPKGLSQIDTVILRCFQALSRLKQTGLSLALFQEMQTMAQINYQYQSREEPFYWISTIAREILDEDFSTFPEKTKIPTKFDPQSVLDFLEALTPDSCAYFVLADPSKLNIQTLSSEKWFGVQYCLNPILDSKLTAWQQAPLHSNIQTPPLNRFVLTSLPVTPSDGEKKEQNIEPKAILNNDMCKIYFAKDESYLVPESALFFRIKSPLLDGSAKSFALVDLFSKALKEQLSATLFFAEKAGISTSFSYKSMQFLIQILGYSEKAPDLTQELFKGLKQVDVSEEKFDLYKTSLLSQYANESCELPVKQANQILASTLLNTSVTAEEKWKALEFLSFEEFSSFYKQWLSQVYLEGMLYGNLTESDAFNLAQGLHRELSSSKPYLVTEQKKQEILLLPSEKGPFKIIQNTPRQGYAAVLAIQEGNFSFPKKASQQILSKALHEAFFKTLRTQQQTGYIAESRPSEIENQLLHTFMVQSSSHTGEDLLARFEIFLSDFTKRAREIIPEDRFNLLKESQIALLTMPPENLLSMAQRLDVLAFEYNADFDRINKRIQSLQSLSYEEFLQDVQLFFSKENSKRLAVLIKGEASGEKPFQYEEITSKELESLGTFSSSGQ